MPKLIALIKAKDELSAQEFIDYYETHHVPLVRRLLPMVGDYRRNYLTDGLTPRNAAVGFDVLTEMWFEDQAALDSFWKRITEPEVIAAIREDEKNFLQSERTKMIGVREFTDR